MTSNGKEYLYAYAKHLLGKENVENGIDLDVFEECIYQITNTKYHAYVPQVLNLRFVEKQTYVNISKIVGISASRVRQIEAKLAFRLNLGIYTLKYLEKPYIEYPKRVGDTWVYD